MDGELDPNAAKAEEDTTTSSSLLQPSTETGEAVSVEDNDDDVVLVEEDEAHAPTSQDRTSPEPAVNPSPTATPSQALSPSVSSNATRPPAAAPAEPIIIDDEEDSEHKTTSANKMPPDGSPDSHSPAALTEPDSEIKIASVTTLGSSGHSVNSPPQTEEGQAEINLMITSVTSLQEGRTVHEVAGEDHTEENGLQISNAFSLNSETPSGRTSTPFNPGRGLGPTDQPVQNGDTGAHNRTDSWISQSASVPRNQKHSGVDSPSKSQGQSSSGSQPRTVKVTCANCKKPLKKGQTAYQRKGSTHLFCSTTCLSAFSHKPAPKKSCTMCKKDITNMKGTIVAQVDSSESFHEFCSTGCLGAYESKQNPPKSGVKTKCTVCGKLTEIRHEVSFKTVTHKICSDACFNVYRRANGLIMNCCEQCGDYLPSRASANHSLLVDGQQKRFCCHNCIRDFKQAHNKLASCVTCKTLIKTGEVLHSIGASGTMGSYCSLSCMNKGKLATASFQNLEPTCHFCKRNALPQYQATLPEGNVLNFCSSQCVTKFQNATLQTTANGQATLSTDDSVQLKCNYCRGAFSLKPEILEWEEKVYQFCSKACCDDYKKLHCIVTFCEYCQEEKTLHETVKFSGIKRPFCSEGCKLLFKQDFIKRLGLKCVSCNHCSQLCKRGVTRQLGGITRDFCSEACAKKFHDWYYKAARCDCCKVQGNLTESVMWRSEMKHFCDQQCLLKFYCQQNEPIMVTQKGPENSVGLEMQGAKLGLVNPSAVAFPGGGLVRDVKNKAVLCKPLTLTKATYCKPHMQSKPLQTEVDDGVKREYVPVPIPVPVFIPMPMNMYTQVTPTPVSLPVPVPVPVFLPTTLQGAEQIIQTINELKTKVPTDPQRADQLASHKYRPDVKPVKIKQERGEDDSGSSIETNSEDNEETDDKYEPELDLEADFPPALDLASDERMEDNTVSIAPAVTPKQEDSESPPRPQPRKQGNKRWAIEESSEQALSFTRSSGQRSNRLPLKSRYGINAWKRWALSPPDQSDDTKVKNDSKSLSRDRAHCNLLALSSEELNLALCRFVQEVCRPNGERYSPDSILYLCLGIQQHLHDKGRKDDLFADPCYQQFVEVLNKVLKNWKPSILPNGSAWGRVEEQTLWSSRQLGDHSPASLLHSLVYLNTKYFGLRNVEQHRRLSFASVYSPDMVHPNTIETTLCIHVPSISQDLQVQTELRKRKLEDGDVDDDSGLYPLTKHEHHLYKLYRDKCPVSVRTSADVLYLQPEPAWNPDGQWFSSTPLETPALESLLTRVLMVRDIYLEKSEEKEQEDRAQLAEGEKQLLG